MKHTRSKSSTSRRRRSSQLRRRRSSRRIRGGDCGCGNSSLQHMMNGQGTAQGTVQGTAQGTAQGIVPGGQYTAFKGGSGSGWNGGPSPFFPANAAYPSYPLNNHMSDPNNPSMVTNAGQPHMIRGGRSRRNRNRSSRRGQRGGSWIPDVLFGNNGNNVVYQSNTTPGAELQRAIFMQKGIDSSPFSQMGPSSHNRLYV